MFIYHKDKKYELSQLPFEDGDYALNTKTQEVEYVFKVWDDEYLIMVEGNNLNGDLKSKYWFTKLVEVTPYIHINNRLDKHIKRKSKPIVVDTEIEEMMLRQQQEREDKIKRLNVIIFQGIQKPKL